MKLKELLPTISANRVNLYDKSFLTSQFIVYINPSKHVGYLSDKLLEREVYSIETNSCREFNICLIKEKENDC